MTIPNATIPLDIEGAEILYSVIAPEPKVLVQLISGMTQIMSAANMSWTMAASNGWDNSNDFFHELIVVTGKIKIGKKFDKSVTIQDPCNTVRGAGLANKLRETETRNLKIKIPLVYQKICDRNT